MYYNSLNYFLWNLLIGNERATLNEINISPNYVIVKL